MIDTVNNNASKFINYFTNKDTSPIFTSTTFTVSTINTTLTTTLTSYNWFIKSDVICDTCVVHNTIHTATGTAITNIDVNENYVSTKYYIDWMKNYVYEKMKKNIQDAAREDLGHVKSSTTEADFILLAYNRNFTGGYGENTYNLILNTSVGETEIKYRFGIDMHNIKQYGTCGIMIANNGGEIVNTQNLRLTPAIGFRKKYIVKMIPTTLEFN